MRCVPAFAGLGVKVIILIHLTRLEASPSKQVRLYHSRATVAMRISDTALGAGMPVCVSAPLSECTCVRACRMCGNKGAAWGPGRAESKTRSAVVALSCWGGRRVGRCVVSTGTHASH